MSKIRKVSSGFFSYFKQASSQASDETHLGQMHTHYISNPKRRNQLDDALSTQDVQTIYYSTPPVVPDTHIWCRYLPHCPSRSVW
jgi:hypothetical protein